MADSSEIVKLQDQILELKKRLAELRRSNVEPVKDYSLGTMNGPRALSSFFEGKQELVVIHNMGRSCNYCTLWADGFNGLQKQIRSRAGFVLVSADSAETVAETARTRGWEFPTASNAGSGFEIDMGYADESGSPYPGISVFTKDGDKINRHGHAPLGEGDDFCAIWHIWDLFPEGYGNWEPR